MNRGAAKEDRLEQVAILIGSFVVVDDNGGPDTEVLHDVIGGDYDEATRRVYALAAAIDALYSQAIRELTAENQGQQNTIDALEFLKGQAEAERNAALREMSKYAAEAGEAKGRLEMSEAARIVDGWRERTEAAEAEVLSLRGALEPFAKIAEPMLRQHPEPDVEILAWASPLGGDLMLSDFRRARSALLDGAESAG